MTVIDTNLPPDRSISTGSLRCPRCHAQTRVQPCQHCGARFGEEQGTTLDEQIDLPAAGSLTPGGYRIDGHLASGGMGLVFHGVHLASGRPVVLKAPRSRDERARLRFQREARALASCNHPNIVRLLDIDTTSSGLPLLVLDRVPGLELRKLLSRAPLPLPLVKRLAGDLARAVDHLHRRGVVHRDIKPENIMVARDRITLIDLSIARIDAQRASAGTQDVLTPTGSILGSPPYAAPEQLADPHQAGFAADIFSLGMTLRDCLGHPRRSHDEIGHHWQQLLQRCCHPQPDQRPDGATILANLQQLELPAATRAARQRRRAIGLSLARLAPALVIGLGAGLIAAAGLWSEQVPRQERLSGHTAAGTTISLRLAEGEHLRLQPQGDTVLRLPGQSIWQRQVLAISGNPTGIVRIQVQAPDGIWDVDLSR